MHVKLMFNWTFAFIIRLERDGSCELDQLRHLEAIHQENLYEI